MSDRKISAVGEFGLIDIISADTLVNERDVIKGIGDDCAVVRALNCDYSQLFTTDMLVENVHFSKLMTAEDIGYKAIACNISDIAAMGGAPQHCLISLALPQAVTVNYVERIYSGMKQCCRKYGVNIVGGDTVRSQAGIIINVTMTGSARNGRVIYRSGAQVGDVVGVTGSLGQSAIGLELLQRKTPVTADEALFVRKHCHPEPRVEYGQALTTAGACAMNDISDGLASELNEIARASGVCISVEEDRIPVAKYRNALQYALYGGEDYELVFTIKHENYMTLDSNTRRRCALIGRVTDDKEPGVWLTRNDGGVVQLKSKGYNHFD